MSLVYAFAHEHERAPMELKDLLGGKGANLAEMTSVLGLPVPPGFTITTDACRAYLDGGWPAELDREIAEHVTSVESAMGRRFGDPADPLLVSVRSGAKFSMPGMMDTILNLGLNDESVRGLAKQTGDARFAFDAYRRFLSMYGRIVVGVDAARFDELLEEAKSSDGVTQDAQIKAETLRDLCTSYQDLIHSESGSPVPSDPVEQLRGAVEAVFRSWNGARAIAYRERERIRHDLGTAVNVQAMVFGNRDDNSGTGVGFTRNPSTGENRPYGDYLVNAQGEDVVAGIRNPEDLDALRVQFPQVHDELFEIFERLEAHYRDMCDTEFTIEQGKLWMLQTRIGKRTGVAALRMAVGMTAGTAWRISTDEAVQRITEDHLDQLLHPDFSREPSPDEILTHGLPASPGAAVGRVYFAASDAVAAAKQGEQVILVRNQTSPDDIDGILASQGLLTVHGGLVSHAAVVARGWGKPAVVGAEHVRISTDHFTVDGTVVRQGDIISISGTVGFVALGELPVTPPQTSTDLDTILGWADDIRRGKLGVRANADNYDDAAHARALGAEGIGLCRTEHMFLAPDRIEIARRMILAASEAEEQAALEELRAAQRADFVRILEAMDGLPVTVRLLDPPLHEFLPSVEALAVKAATAALSPEEQKVYEAASAWHEVNPMLGVRGVRLGVLKPGLYAMQVRALLEAATERAGAGGNPTVEIMIPLTITRAELALARRWCQQVIDEAAENGQTRLDIEIGTMIETPRACLRADELALEADFFSFGTNDLTQMTLGFSRDDVEGRMMDAYLSQGLLPHNPFHSIDAAGVGELVTLGVSRGRASKPGLKIGVCGEHGGDPESIAFLYEAGIDYVSCSPFRVPIARLAAAQVILRSTSPAAAEAPGAVGRGSQAGGAPMAG